MKKCLALTLAALMVVPALAGCGSKNEGPVVEDGRTVVRIMSSGSGYWESSLDPYIEKYNESQDKYLAKIEYFGRSDLMSSIEAKLGSGSSEYDVICVDAPMVAAYSVRGYLKPLDEYFTEEEIAQYTDAMVTASTWDGQFMAAPMNNSSQLLWYNADYLKQAGYDSLSTDPENRITWEELVTIAEDVVNTVDPTGEKGISGINFDQVGLVYQMLQLPNSMGAPSLGSDGFTVKGVLDSQGWLDALHFYQDISDSGLAARGLTYNDVLSNFVAGNIFCIIGGTWTASSAEEAGLNYAYTYSPCFEGHEEEVATPTDSWHIGINAYSQNPDGAADFIKYITLGEGEQWNRAAGNVPSTKAGLEEVLSGDYGEVMAMAAYEAQNTAYPRPVTPAFSEYETAVNALFEDVRSGANVEDSVQNTIEKLNTAFKKYQ